MNPLMGKELWEEGRRVRTFVLRVLFILAVFTMVWISNFDLDGRPNSSNRHVGLAVFMGLALSLVGVVTLLSPALTVPSVVREVEDGTFDMLLCSKLSLRKIVITKVAARTIVVLTMVLACAPVMALATYYGGVSPTQAAAALTLLCSLTFVYGAVGVQVGLTTRKNKSALGGMVGWLVRYNVITAFLTLNPFISVALCAGSSRCASAFVASALNMILGVRAIRKTLDLARSRKEPAFEEILFPEHSAAFPRTIFTQSTNTGRPLRDKELQEGNHAAIYVIGLFLVCGCIALDLIVGGSTLTDVSGSGWGSVRESVGYFKFVAGFHVVLLVICSVLLLSQVVSRETEQGTLDLLVLTNLSPLRLLMEKAGSLRVPFRPITISCTIHVAVLSLLAVLVSDNRAFTMAQLLAGASAIAALFAFFCSAAVFASVWARSSARAAQVATGILAVGLVLPLVVDPFGSSTAMHCALLKLLALWPNDIEFVPCMLTAFGAAVAAGLLIITSVTRLGRREN